MIPDELLKGPWLPSLLGAALAQRALGAVGWLVRLGHGISSIGFAVLFGPALSRWLGTASDEVANAAVIAAVAAYGIIVFDASLLWLKSLSFPELLAGLQQVLGIVRGLGGKGGDRNDDPK